MENALVSAYLLNGDGSGREIGWTEIGAWSSEQELLWMHLDFTKEQTQEWLHHGSQLAPIVAEALSAEDTRPRCFSHDNGLLVILRGVNMNPGADPDDMVSIRIWLEPGRIISIRHRRVMAIDDLRKKLDENKGPESPGDFLVQLCERLSSRIGDTLESIEDSVDLLEEEALEKGSTEQRTRLHQLRRQIIRLRRYLAPQREVMNRLQLEKTGIFSEGDRLHLREIADHITRYVEDLDSVKDRATVCQEELESRMSAQMNKTLYVLSIITAIFLPLGLITGLLGINVGGIPGSENPLAFVFVCLMLGVIVFVQVLIFKKIRWV